MIEPPGRPDMILLDVAKAEGEAAADWYERRRAGLGDDFLAELRLALQFVEKSPRLCGQLEPARSPRTPPVDVEQVSVRRPL